MIDQVQDLYIDYLISSFGPVTATDLPAVLDGATSHDQVTRMLSQPASISKDLWLRVKPFVRKIGQRYVQYINRTYLWHGSLWEGRFRSCLVGEENYFLACHLSKNKEQTMFSQISFRIPKTLIFWI